MFADVIREGGGPAGEDDKIYYFFTEVSVEYEFFGKLFIPRVARVCKVGGRARQRARHCARHCARHPRPASRPPPLPSPGFIYLFVLGMGVSVCHVSLCLCV